MDKINFFTPVKSSDSAKSFKLFLLEKIDGYFYLGGKRAEILSIPSQGCAIEVKLVNSRCSLLAIALKVASYCTLLMPALALTAKVFLRSNYDFYIVHGEKLSGANLNSSNASIKNENQGGQPSLKHPSAAKGSATSEKSEPLSGAHSFLCFVVKSIAKMSALFSSSKGKEDYPTIEGAKRSQEEKMIINETQDLKAQNEVMTAQIEKLHSFVNNDPDLKRTFVVCLRETQEILLPPPVKDNSPPHPNEIVEAWGQEMQQANYLDSVKTRVRDFLDKNPAFWEILRRKIEQGSSFPSTPAIDWL
ncbi:DUF648 domain-containing protein [Parachlamydia sp. AcF125]|uniref:DUF648 domain-containing protein n=1 Tax=Parachlamydia sp. AcF125 TaxID=2795736 RepID=UPI001BC93681|nr:DUF648 domain-containing protein [Parachlamydia sp. AcF125]MBS4168153.1 hypothetical protein [Parachlamydia sp. AcF125]